MRHPERTPQHLALLLMGIIVSFLVSLPLWIGFAWLIAKGLHELGLVCCV
jgi:hypothetical protein